MLSFSCYFLKNVTILFQIPQIPKLFDLPLFFWKKNNYPTHSCEICLLWVNKGKYLASIPGAAATPLDCTTLPGSMITYFGKEWDNQISENRPECNGENFPRTSFCNKHDFKCISLWKYTETHIQLSTWHSIQDCNVMYQRCRVRLKIAIRRFLEGSMRIWRFEG